MSKLQTTSAIGIGSIGTGATNLLSLFNDCKINEVFATLPTLDFDSAVKALLLILIGVYGMWHDENKQSVPSKQE